MTVVSTESLAGTWRRNSISWPDGRKDLTTTVLWTQAREFYADIRIPAARPSFAGVCSLQECTFEQLRWLGSQQGFAGRLGKIGDAFHWRREIDYQPPTAYRDVGRLLYLNAGQTLMQEDGVEEPYIEIWERIDHPPSAVQTKLFNRGFIVASQNHFIFARDRRLNQPSGSSLVELLSTYNHDEAHKLLDMEISHAIRTAAGTWLIDHSTFPWREGLTGGTAEELLDHLHA